MNIIKTRTEIVRYRVPVKVLNFYWSLWLVPEDNSVARQRCGACGLELGIGRFAEAVIREATIKARAIREATIKARAIRLCEDCGKIAEDEYLKIKQGKS